MWSQALEQRWRGSESVRERQKGLKKSFGAALLMEQPLSSASSGEPLVAGGGLRQTLAQITDKVDLESLTSQLAPDCDSNKLKLLIGTCLVGPSTQTPQIKE